MEPIVVTSREFNQNPGKYLNPGKYVITKHGKPILTFEVAAILDKEKTAVAVKKLIAEEESVLCKHEGCEKKGISDKGYCSEHWGEAK